MTQAEDEEDDLLRQAEVLLEHRRRRNLDRIIIIVALFMGVALVLLTPLFEVGSGGRIDRATLLWCIFPLLLLPVLVHICVWRCSACNRYLGSYDVQFCPHCGVQLQFLDK